MICGTVQLCVPVSDAFRARAEDILPVVGAVTHKMLDEETYSGKCHFLESSINVASPEFKMDIVETGTLEALQSGIYDSFSCDVGCKCRVRIKKSKNGYSRAVPWSELVLDEDYLSQAAENIGWLRSHYVGAIRLENNNYFPTGAYERVCEPEFITKLLQVTETDLLLDIGHAVISAHHLDYASPEAYIDELPLDRVREIHLSRSGILNGVLEDLHDVPRAEDFDRFSRTSEAAGRVETLTIEYYRDAETLARIYRELDR